MPTSVVLSGSRRVASRGRNTQVRALVRAYEKRKQAMPTSGLEANRLWKAAAGRVALVLLAMRGRNAARATRAARLRPPMIRKLAGMPHTSLMTPPSSGPPATPAQHGRVERTAVAALLSGRGQVADIRHGHRVHDGGGRPVNDHDQNEAGDRIGRQIGERGGGVKEQAGQQEVFPLPAVGQAADKGQDQRPGGGVDAEQQARPQLAETKLLDIDGQEGHDHAVAQHGGENGQ